MVLHFRTGRVGRPPHPHNEEVNQKVKMVNGETESQASTLVVCVAVKTGIIQAVGVDSGMASADHLYVVIRDQAELYTRIKNVRCRMRSCERA